MLKAQNNLFSGICTFFGNILLFLVFSLLSATGAQALSFNTPVTFAVGSIPSSLASGDFNRDGNLDLVVTNRATNNVTILLGNGDGTFTTGPATPINVGSAPVSVTVGDFDRDGILDIAVANNATNNVSILLGDGSGNFPTSPAGSPFGLNGGVAPVSIATADFDRDGRLDLVVANRTTSNVSVLLGGASGTFGTAINFNLGINQTNPSSVAIGDFDLDGNLDIAVANNTTNNVSILVGDSTGSFTATAGSPFGLNGGGGPTFIATADFDRDGIPDLAVANTTGNVSILIGFGDATFGPATNFNSGLSPSSIAIGDYNGDGIQDIAIANLSSNNFVILLGVGDGTFATAVNFAVGVSPVSIVAGDLNLDGKPDLAVANASNNNVSVLINTTTFGAAGVFDKAVSSNVGTGPDAITNADFDLDGKLDLAVANFTSNNVSMLLSAGFGNFFAAVTFAVGTGPSALIPGDFNRDGKPDLAVANNGSNNVSVLLGDGSGNFTSSSFGAGTGPRSIVTGDFNRDGKPDLAVANNGSNNVSVLLGDGSGNFAAAVAYAAGTGPTAIVTGDFQPRRETGPGSGK